MTGVAFHNMKCSGVSPTLLDNEDEIPTDLNSAHNYAQYIGPEISTIKREVMDCSLLKSIYVGMGEAVTATVRDNNALPLVVEFNQDTDQKISSGELA